MSDEFTTIDAAVDILRQEIPDAVKIEHDNEIITVWVDSYAKKRPIYERYGVGETLFPARIEGWIMKVKKHPPFVRTKPVSEETCQ